MNNIGAAGAGTMPAQDGKNVTASAPKRRPLYFASGERRIFGWYHAAIPDHARDCAVVVCNPLGYEYTHSHRSLRHLAEELSASGLAALRFDYDGTGDSPGEDLAPDRVNCWLQDIRAAVTTARELSGCSRICLLGVRMGAGLAAVVASQDDIDHLVLWNPCSGRAYVREMKALAMAAATETDNTLGFESAGFMLLHETAEQLKSINLLKLPFQHDCDVLLIQRDDIEFDPALEQRLRTDGVDVTQLALPGYANMMAEPQFTIVPATAIAAIADWLEKRTSQRQLQQLPTALQRIDTYNDVVASQAGVEIVEHCCLFGKHDLLFGIATEPKHHANTATRPAVVLLNAGSVHHVGPNRLYVTLARKLAALGYLCFRFDLQGLGESALRHGKRENHPYPDSASDDTANALQFLHERFGHSDFVLAGLCSGAHSAFHAGKDLLQFNISEIILINPLTFRYVEGMSLETTSHYMDVAYYKGSARQLRSWLKLLRGQVDIGNLLRLGWSQLKIMTKTIFDAQRERLFNQPTSQLSADIRVLLAHNRALSLFVADSEPGYSLLSGNAKYMTAKGMKSKIIGVQFVAKGDHTFSRFSPRRDVVERICAHIDTRYGRYHNPTKQSPRPQNGSSTSVQQ